MDNKEELNEVVDASKSRMKRNKASIEAIDLQNVPVDPLRTLGKVLTVDTPLVELILQDTQLLPQECAFIGANVRLKQLRTLDLSCNKIGLKGLCHLLDL